MHKAEKNQLKRKTDVEITEKAKRGKKAKKAQKNLSDEDEIEESRKVKKSSSRKGQKAKRVDTDINFNSRTKENSFLSNFFPDVVHTNFSRKIEVKYKGISFPSVEHGYQYAKFLADGVGDIVYAKIIAKAKGAAKAKSLASISSYSKWKQAQNAAENIKSTQKEIAAKMKTKRTQWINSGVSLAVMETLLLSKFSKSNPEIHKALLDTKAIPLHEVGTVLICDTNRTPVVLDKGR